MKITLLNANANAEQRGFADYLATYQQCLEERGHEVERLALRDLDIRYCNGCWDCWMKTPGRCVHNDDMGIVYRSLLASDLLIMVSPLIAGFPSSLLKKAQDRLVPLVLPYLQIEAGEFHHRARYAHYPLLGLLLEKEADTDSEDLQIASDFLKRFALNFKSRVALFDTMDTAPEELADATGNF